jgi:hypothetical protein
VKQRIGVNMTWYQLFIDRKNIKTVYSTRKAHLLEVKRHIFWFPKKLSKLDIPAWIILNVNDEMKFKGIGDYKKLGELSLARIEESLPRVSSWEPLEGEDDYIPTLDQMELSDWAPDG